MSNGKPDPARLLAGVFQSGQNMMRQFAWAGGSGDGKVDPAAQLISTSQKFVGMQQDLIKQMTGYWSGMMGMATPEQATAGTKDNDRRFAGEAWSNDPRYDLVKRTYLAYSSLWQQIVESAPADEKTKAKLRYDMRQFVDAMSPSNFLATNPEAMQLAVETGGQSIAQGMKLFFDDLGKRAHLDDRRERLRGRQQPRGNAGGCDLRERTDPADPVRAARPSTSTTGRW